MASWEIQDRHLWIGFGVFLFVAVKGIERCLQTTTRLNEIYDPENAKAANGSQAEESISLEALSTLVTSHNQDISNSATSLLLTRFAQDNLATTSLTHDLFSPNPSTRALAKQTLELFDALAIDLYPLSDTTVTSLSEKSSPTVQTMCKAYFKAVRRYRQGRLACLVDIADMVEESTRIVQGRRRERGNLESRFVFPQQQDDQGGMTEARFQPVSQRVESLVDMLAEQAVATRPMMRFAERESGGVTSSSTTSESPPALNGFGGVDGDDEVPHVAGRTRFQASSNHEAEVRRSRREAMVLHEGGGMIGSQDIIHPRTDNHH